MKNRSQSDLNRSSRSSTQLSYEALEKRNLLAGDLLSASYEFSDSTGNVRTLAEPVPVQERFGVLNEAVDVEEGDYFRRTGLVRDDLGLAEPGSGFLSRFVFAFSFVALKRCCSGPEALILVSCI